LGLRGRELKSKDGLLVHSTKRLNTIPWITERLFLINFNNTNLVLKRLSLARKSPRFLQKSFVKTNERMNVDSEQKIRFLVKRVSLFSEHRLQEVA
jgi:hypothetical protein